MLTCIACSKQLPGGAPPPREPPEDEEEDEDNAFAGGRGESAATPSTRHAVKSLTAQIKDMALKASGAYRHCKPCAGSSPAAASSRRHHPYGAYADSKVASASDRFHYAYRRAGSSAASTPRLRSGGAMSSGDVTPSASTRTDFLVGDEEGEDGEEVAAGGSDEDEAKEWVAQVEPGVLITFLSLPQGGNDLKRIRFRCGPVLICAMVCFIVESNLFDNINLPVYFVVLRELMHKSREMFTKWRAQRWWTENYEKVMELYNVQKFNSQAAPLPSTPRSDNESSKEDNPATDPHNKGHLPNTLHRPLKGSGAIGYSSSDALEHKTNHLGNDYRHDRYLGHQCYDSGGLASTPKLSSISGAKTEISSVDASVRTSSSPEEVDPSGELSASVSNASDQEREWVEEDEPGVYITIRALPGGIRELRRVRFRFAVFYL
ncbi:Protein Brevis radix-like 1 [Dichanthelium oligosanthes]|uniref:Protein Brevis radix-like 1 n=1 Tax=Dichanthelium oligosanthes TaxID=888268 RepID=A0A1E5VGI9_9POAL|nr:Protein Brevis radix-like 1 [Dichanthelium oligosanthes]